MGRITVSLPDSLEAQLDAFARDKGLPVSQVVASALQAYLDAPGPPPPPPPPAGGEDPAARAYLELVGGQLEAILHTLNDMSARVAGPLLPLNHPPPLPLPPPSWRR